MLLSQSFLKVKLCSPVEADAAGEQLVELLHPAATLGPGPAPLLLPASSLLFTEKFRFSIIYQRIKMHV